MARPAGVADPQHNGIIHQELLVGIRTHLPEAGLEFDISWGGHIQDDLRGAGLTFGLALVSGRIF